MCLANSNFQVIQSGYHSQVFCMLLTDLVSMSQCTNLFHIVKQTCFFIKYVLILKIYSVSL